MSERQNADYDTPACEFGCLGHGGAGVCPHCGDWHRDDFSRCPAPRTVARCWVCPDHCPIGDCQRDNRAIPPTKGDDS